MSVSGSSPRAALWNLPNLLTLSRVVLGVVALILIGAAQYAAALLVFGVAALTDALDGILARRMGLVTAFGRQLDPLVDKLVITAIFVFLLPIPGAGVPAWVVAPIVARELLIQWLRSVLEGRGEAFGANLAGKLKTVAQCLAIALVLVVLASEPASTPLRWARDLSLWSALILTLYSGLAYLVGSWSRIVEASSR